MTRKYLLGTPKFVFSALQHHLKSGESACGHGLLVTRTEISSGCSLRKGVTRSSRRLTENFAPNEPEEVLGLAGETDSKNKAKVFLK